MFKAIGALFSALFVLFGAMERGAKAIDHLARIAEEEAEGLATQMAEERKERLEQFRRDVAHVATLSPQHAA